MLSLISVAHLGIKKMSKIYPAKVLIKIPLFSQSRNFVFLKLILTKIKLITSVQCTKVLQTIKGLFNIINLFNITGIYPALMSVPHFAAHYPASPERKFK